MKSDAQALAGHFRIRLRAVLRDPAALSMLLLAGLATLLLWPGLTGADGAGWSDYHDRYGPEGRPYQLFVTLLWLMLWPAIPVIHAAGRAGARSMGDALAQRALPALPVGPRCRTLSDALLVLGFVFAARLLLLLAPGTGGPASLALDTLMGAFVALPMLLAWAAPAGSYKLLWWKPFLMLALIFLCMRAGLLARPWTLVLTCAALSVPPLLVAGRELRLPVLWERPAGGPETRRRPPAHPERCFRRDLWLEPARRYRWVLAAAAALLVVIFVLDQVTELPGLAFFLGMETVFILVFVTMAFRPAGSDLIAASLVGVKGYQRGDFARAWSSLPLRRETVFGGIYRYALLSSAGMWGLLLVLIAARAWLNTGRFRLAATDGFEVAWMLVPAVALAPCWAGFLTSVAIGDRLGYIFPGLGLLFAVHVHPILSLVHPWPDLWILLFFALAGGLPALRHGYRRRRPGGRRAPGPAAAAADCDLASPQEGCAP